MDLIPSRYYFPSPGFSLYWNNGRGVHLSEKIGRNFPAEESIRKKIPMLFQVDELADRVIREVMLVDGFQQTISWIDEYLSGKKNEQIPQILIELLDFSIQCPDWVDPERVEKGAKLCRRSGTRGFMVLRNYCLMGGYESAAINKPLIFTGALKKGAAKRTSETTDFWVKVVDENALENPKGGIRECVKIRLMHAYARVSILQGTDWRKENWGEPLNQWDMLATNLGFSLVFLDGIRSLGLSPNRDEVDGLFHFWKYVGYLLGISTEILPETEEEAIKELYAWTITQPPADRDTKELAKALMLEPMTTKFPTKLWQKKRFVQVHLAYNYFFLGKNSCEAMGLPVKGWTIYPALFRLITRIQEAYYRTSERAFEKGVKSRREEQVKIANLYLHGMEKRI